MFEFLRQLITGIGEAWQHLSASARVQIVLAALLTVAVLTGAVIVGGRPQFARLYSRLDPSEANEITVWLAGNDIPYQLKDGGRTILVPIGDVQASRVGLVGLGLPRTQGVGDAGFEKFTDRDLMTNQWLQNVDFMRAVEGELQRQLNQFDFVRQSYAFIREAPEQLFVSEQKPSEAGVTLDTTRPLTKREVSAILNIVSSFGGPNLNRRNITLALTDGTLLHSPVEDEFAALAGDQLEAQVARESEREKKVREALEALGLRAVVRVSADMDWSGEERVSKTFTEGVPVSILETSTTTRSTKAPPEGPPGATSNIPEGMGGPGSVLSSTETNELLENYENGESLVTTTRQPGSVTGFRVAAFIQGHYTTPTDESGEATGEPVYEGLTAEEISQYQGFIANAVGEGVQASDVQVYDHPFKIDGLAAPQVVAALVGLPWYQRDVVRWGIQVAAILAMFFTVRLFMRRALVLPTVEEEEVVEIPEASPEVMRRMEVAAEVERLSREEPENVAALLRSWMAEEE